MIWARFWFLSPGHSEPLLESTVQVGAGTKTSKNEFGGVKNLIFWPLLRALPQLRELRRNFAESASQTVQRTSVFTATSQQLHSNFTATSHELRRHFTRTSQTSRRFTITKSVTKLRRYLATLHGG